MVGWLQRLVHAGRIVACCALLIACTQVHNDPINQPLLPGAAPSAELGRGVETYYDDTVIALSFSGGGTRAAAFSYGVLTALDQTATPNRSTSLLDRVDFVTGVSGGSVLAGFKCRRTGITRKDARRLQVKPGEAVYERSRIHHQRH